MKVILQHNVVKLGKVGDVVDISDGYYRNFLQPRKLAVVATTGSLKKREEEMETIRRKVDAAHKETLAFAEKITALEKISIFARDGEGGKLYGKVTTKEIAEVLKKHLDAEVDKRLIKINEDITALGTYKVVVKLTADVHANIAVEVLSEGNKESAAKLAAAGPQAFDS
jgi:large subunit ribosomal protein L9